LIASNITATAGFYPLSFLGSARHLGRKQTENGDYERVKERLRLALDAAYMGIWDWNILTNQITFRSLRTVVRLNSGTFGSNI